MIDQDDSALSILASYVSARIRINLIYLHNHIIYKGKGELKLLISPAKRCERDTREIILTLCGLKLDNLVIGGAV